MPLELTLWRAACRQVDLHDFVSRVTPLLAEHFPLDELLVRRIDLPASRLETVALDVPRTQPPPQRARTELSQAELAQLIAWSRAGAPLRGASRRALPVLSLIVPPDVNGPVLAGPLLHDDGPIGVVTLIAPPGQAFTPEHELKLAPLLEPLSMALHLDRHFHELARLREAAEADNRALLSRLGREEIVETIVGADLGLREVMARVEQVAPTDAPVLILGETGSGKEVVARAIHARSRRAGGPVVRVNCGAIPPELIDSELFGHERGSFTGAVNTRKGWFERADGGTLFLDEIGELPLAAQVRLLRILQDGSFERVGGQRPLTVDVRIVAATHMDVPSMVMAGTFRQDLWYRIGVFLIRLPPLREHPEDIPALARYFAARAGRRLIGTPLEPSLRDLELLTAHNWPGNVRELSAVIERAAILGNCRRLDVPAALATFNLGQERAPAGWSPEPRPPAPGSPGPVPQPSFRPPLLPSTPVSSSADPLMRFPAAAPPRALSASLETLESTMARHITDALILTHGRIEGPHGAAALLGINPHTLRARMRKLKIDWSQYRPGNPAR